MIVGVDWTRLTDRARGRQVGTSYEYEYRISEPPKPEIVIRFTLSGVREYRDSLQGEVKVEVREKGNEGELLRDRLTLVSSRSKNAFAKALGARTKLAIPWPEIVELVCLVTADTFREGEPFIFLGDVPDRPEQRSYLIRHFVPYGHTSVLYGDGSAGKSLLSLSMAIAVATGKALPGIEPLKPPMPVMYLDWETTEEDQAHYLHAIERAHGVVVPREMLIYRRMSRSLSSEAARIKEEVDRQGVGFLTVDSMIPACGGEPESAEVVLNFFNALRSLGTLSRQVVSHITKAEAERKGQPRPFGSVFTTNLARSTWLARRTDHGGDNLLEIGLYHTKTNLGPLLGARGIRYHFGQETKMVLRLSEFSVADVPELGEHMPLANRIRGVLKRGGATVKEIAETLDANTGSVKSRLHRMRDTTVLDAGNTGKAKTWVLRAHEEDSRQSPTTRTSQEEIPF